MVMMPTAERTGAEASGSTMWDGRYSWSRKMERSNNKKRLEGGKEYR